MNRECEWKDVFMFVIYVFVIYVFVIFMFVILILNEIIV